MIQSNCIKKIFNPLKTRKTFYLPGKLLTLCSNIKFYSEKRTIFIYLHISVSLEISRGNDVFVKFIIFLLFIQLFMNEIVY